MKVFRISGRDCVLAWPRYSPECLNESLPHKRKRHGTDQDQSSHKGLGLNESLPHKRKRPSVPPQPTTRRQRLNESLPHKRKRRCMRGLDGPSHIYASMKVFRISGRDVDEPTNRHRDCHRLNESLPHKRKRPSSVCSGRGCLPRLNESLPHKRKRLAGFVRGVFLLMRLNESLPHKRKRPLRVFGSSELPKL